MTPLFTTVDQKRAISELEQRLGNYILDIGREQDHPSSGQGGGDGCVRVPNRGEVRHG